MASPYPSLQPTKDGTVPFLVPGAGKECVTYYKVFGDIKEAGKVPCVLVHGGPGLSHDYMLSFIPLFEQFDVPLVLYDQIGNGLSTHLPEKKGDEEFWTDDLFHAELTNLLRKLGLDESGFNLVGHSWGGMMGATFAAKHPKGLRKLVISNSPASIGPWVDAYNTYRLEMPQELQDTMKRFEDAEDWDNEEYQNIMINHFYKKHMCTVTPWPEELTKSFEWAANDMTVALTTYNLSPIRRNHSNKGLTDAMSRNGPSEFEVTGGQRNWSAVESAKNISVPTLVINGTAEGATDEAVRPFVEGIKGSKWVKFKNSTHMPMYEERKRYFDVLKEFLLD